MVDIKQVQSDYLKFVSDVATGQSGASGASLSQSAVAAEGASVQAELMQYMSDNSSTVDSGTASKLQQYMSTMTGSAGQSGGVANWNAAEVQVTPLLEQLVNEMGASGASSAGGAGGASSTSAGPVDVDNGASTPSTPLTGARSGLIASGSALETDANASTAPVAYSSTDNLFSVKQSSGNFNVYGANGVMVAQNVKPGDDIRVTNPDTSLGQAADVTLDASGNFSGTSAGSTPVATLTGDGTNYTSDMSGASGSTDTSSASGSSDTSSASGSSDTSSASGSLDTSSASGSSDTSSASGSSDTSSASGSSDTSSASGSSDTSTASASSNTSSASGSSGTSSAGGGLFTIEGALGGQKHNTPKGIKSMSGANDDGHKIWVNYFEPMASSASPLNGDRATGKVAAMPSAVEFEVNGKKVTLPDDMAKGQDGTYSFSGGSKYVHASSGAWLVSGGQAVNVTTGASMSEADFNKNPNNTPAAGSPTHSQ